MGIDFRECTNDDLQQVLSLQKQWEKDEITYGFIAADLDYLKSKLGHYFYIATLNTNVLGFIYGNVQKAKNLNMFEENEPYLEIEDLYISPNYRDLGLGGQLLDQVLKVANENGVKRSMIYSSTKDLQHIINFYEKHEYKTFCIQMYK